MRIPDPLKRYVFLRNGPGFLILWASCGWSCLVMPVAAADIWNRQASTKRGGPAMQSMHLLANEMNRERHSHAEQRRHGRQLLAGRRAAWRAARARRHGRKATRKALLPRPE